MEEVYGCVKYIGMSYDMVRSLPIQERKMMIRKYNMDSEAIDRDLAESQGSDSRRYEGEQLNDFARLEQNNQRVG